MLVLTRRPAFKTRATLPLDVVAAALAAAGHSVLIGPDIRVRVLSMGDGQVKLGIEAPDDVVIQRDEVER